MILGAIAFFFSLTRYVISGLLSSPEAILTRFSLKFSEITTTA